MPSPALTAAVLLAQDEWLPRASAHERRVDTLTAGHRERAARREKHAVEDFLWTYYSYKPRQLRRWHPGAGVVLAGDAAAERADWRYYRQVDGGVAVDLDEFLADRGRTVDLVRRLLAATASRPAQLGCFGLHEWAMVYRLPEEQVRHAAYPLRLGRTGTDEVVEGHRIRCSHFDAFRFFTDEAVPRNELAPTRDRQVDMEQPGCLHATMDLYKWAHKLAPAVSSDLVLDCFLLARDVRVLDMRASPYDLSDLGYEPVRIETPEGKQEYAAAQRGFTARGQALRARLLAALEDLAGADG